MGLQWTVIAAIMYVELFVAFLLVVPFITPSKWQKVFKSSFLRSLSNMSHIYFKVILFVLGFLFIDAYREQRKYAVEASKHLGQLDADMQAQMKMFRAQRNLYICGAALVLWIVIRRLSSLLSCLAVALAEKEAALSQAKSASATASQLMRDSTGDGKGTESIKKLEEENTRLKAENESSLKQAKGVNQEYDRLMKEHAKLQTEFKKISGSDETKKSE